MGWWLCIWTGSRIFIAIIVPTIVVKSTTTTMMLMMPPEIFTMMMILWWTCYSNLFIWYFNDWTRRKENKCPFIITSIKLWTSTLWTPTNLINLFFSSEKNKKLTVHCSISTSNERTQDSKCNERFHFDRRRWETYYFNNILWNDWFNVLVAKFIAKFIRDNSNETKEKKIKCMCVVSMWRIKILVFLVFCWFFFRFSKYIRIDQCRWLLVLHTLRTSSLQ